MDRDIVGACGLLCSECEAFLATQANDGAEIEAIARKWTDMYGATIVPDTVWCDGCMTAGYHKCGHTAECEIRSCVVGRELSSCADCTHYACDRLEAFLDRVSDTEARERLESMRPIF